uniref:NADH-ubiquinone oxidoreductase chain 6 n=1 Tax=Chrysolina haemoptera TaxID=75519 RepID=A0A1P8NMG0_CHRHA|nr:NADH dehydrogenase subunit 6 [Chrysolina haemoptera]
MFFSTMICLFSMIFMFLTHPLSLGLILLIQTISISMISGMMNYNFWFSYILFLIMVGGMLILFIYMTSVASNEKFKFSFKIMNLMFLSMLLIFMIMFIDNFYYSLFMNLSDMMNQNYMKNNNLSMNKYMNFPNNFMIYMMMIYLFITLIMVVKITSLKYGPLRQKF